MSETLFRGSSGGLSLPTAVEEAHDGFSRGVHALSPGYLGAFCAVEPHLVGKTHRDLLAFLYLPGQEESCALGIGFNHHSSAGRF